MALFFKFGAEQSLFSMAVLFHGVDQVSTGLQQASRRLWSNFKIPGEELGLALSHFLRTRGGGGEAKW